MEWLLPSIVTVEPAPAPEATGASSAAGSPERLRALAAQFESLLIGQMMRSMRSSVFDDGKETGFEDGPLSDTLYSELSLALSRAGGFGLGKALAEPLARQAQQASGMNTPVATALASLAAAGAVASSPESGGSAPAPTTPPAAAAPTPHSIGGRVSSAYGWRRDPIDGTEKFHKGMDIAMPVGTDVEAAKAGEVAFTGNVPGYGLTVVVNHPGQVTTRYAHLSEIGVVPGQTVAEGQVIARSGATGRVTGPHLHFEVTEAGQPIDPESYAGRQQY